MEKNQILRNRSKGEVAMSEHRSIKNRAEGMFHQVSGKIKETTGKLINNQEMEDKGKKENLSGKVQEKIGQAEKVLDM